MFSYEKQGSSTFLTYELDSAEQIDTIDFGMLTHNKIRGFASMIFSQVDTMRYLKYNISGKIALNQVISAPISTKRLLDVFCGIIDSMLTAEEYMLDTNHIFLDTNYIYLDVSTNEIALICLPICEHKMKNSDMSLFFKNIMFSCEFEQYEYVGKIVKFLNSQGVFSLLDFKELLGQIRTETSYTNGKTRESVKSVGSVAPSTNVETNPPVLEKQKIEPASTMKAVVLEKTESKSIPLPSLPVSEKTVEVKNEGKKIGLFGNLIRKTEKEGKKEVVKKEKDKPTEVRLGIPIPKGVVGKQSELNLAEKPTIGVPPTPTNRVKETVGASVAVTPPSSFDLSKGGNAFFGETTVLNAETCAETSVLVETSSSRRVLDPYIERERTGEKIKIDKPFFRIGKEKSYVDYFVADNQAISRGHANIVKKENRFYIVDTNSTNHTYVNGTIIEPNLEYPIEHRDVIRLANEEFTFYCE